MMQQLTPVTRNIIVINVIVYLLSNFIDYPKLYYLLSVFYPTSSYFHWWQIITHMFMHAPFRESGGIMHILFNMFTLWSFGPILEQVLGGRKYLILYLLSGIGACLLNFGWVWFEIYRGEDPSQIINIPMMGASGAIFGVVAAFATLFPDAKIAFLFIPFPIKAKILLPIVIVISVLLGYNGNVGGIAHFAHVGGALVGWLMASYWKKNRYGIN